MKNSAKRANERL